MHNTGFLKLRSNHATCLVVWSLFSDRIIRKVSGNQYFLSSYMLISLFLCPLHGKSVLLNVRALFLILVTAVRITLESVTNGQWFILDKTHSSFQSGRSQDRGYSPSKESVLIPSCFCVHSSSVIFAGLLCFSASLFHGFLGDQAVQLPAFFHSQAFMCLDYLSIA